VNLIRWPDLPTRHQQLAEVRCTSAITFVLIGVLVDVVLLLWHPAAAGTHARWLGGGVAAALVAYDGWRFYRQKST
jgi:hypothetical protein